MNYHFQNVKYTQMFFKCFWIVYSIKGFSRTHFRNKLLTLLSYVWCFLFLEKQFFSLQSPFSLQLYNNNKKICILYLQVILTKIKDKVNFFVVLMHEFER